jgi:hypothetical protein
LGESFPFCADVVGAFAVERAEVGGVVVEVGFYAGQVAYYVVYDLARYAGGEGRAFLFLRGLVLRLRFRVLFLVLLLTLSFSQLVFSPLFSLSFLHD